MLSYFDVTLDGVNENAYVCSHDDLLIIRISRRFILFPQGLLLWSERRTFLTGRVRISFVWPRGRSIIPFPLFCLLTLVVTFVAGFPPFRTVHVIPTISDLQKWTHYLKFQTVKFVPHSDHCFAGAFASANCANYLWRWCEWHRVDIPEGVMIRGKCWIALTPWTLRIRCSLIDSDLDKMVESLITLWVMVMGKVAFNCLESMW